MPRLQVELIIESTLSETGGTLFVVPNSLPRAEFDARYILPEDDSDILKVRANLSAMVNFVHIDTPEGDYTYRIVRYPDSASGPKVANEIVIGVAGAGALYMDATTNEPIYVDSGRDHHILGKLISKNESLGIENNSLDLRVDQSQCTVFGPVRVCPARQEEVAQLLKTLRLEAAE